MMPAHDLTAFLSTHGLWLLAPLALVEGPLVTIAAGALVAKGILPLPAVFIIATLADLAGDALLWLAGSLLRHRLPRRLHRRIARTLPPRTLRRHAGRILTLGKLTHSAGALVLLAAGIARVPFARFVGYNLAATLPKVAALLALGWTFGATLPLPDSLSALVQPVALVAAVGLMGLMLHRAGKPRCA